MRFLYDLFFLFLVAGCMLRTEAQSIIDLELVSTGLTFPVDISFADDETLYVVERNGVIRTLSPDGTLDPTPFLDIDSRVQSGGGNSEQGLLGLVFHPEYPDSNYIYVNYTVNGGDTRISRFTVNVAQGAADPDSEKLLLTQDQPFGNHNAGDLAFGPDGMLYFGLGDGGSGGDPINAGQTRSTLLGKMLRIDVDSGDPYAVPPDNPFVTDPNTLDEIWALGLRNPWRFSFDRANGDMWIGDVGQGEWEEINRQPGMSSGGENYGWRCYEGNNAFNLQGCQQMDAYVFPVWEYEHGSAGCSVTGGFVYRGTAIPALAGKYVYADFCSGRIWALTEDSGVWTNEELLNTPYNISTFGEDNDGELYLADLDGDIYRIVEGTITSYRESLAFNRFQVAPNPTSDKVLLQMDAVVDGEYQFQLLNLDGKTIRTWKDSIQGTYSKSISLQELPAGVYVLRIRLQALETSVRLTKW